MEKQFFDEIFQGVKMKKIRARVGSDEVYPYYFISKSEESPLLIDEDIYHQYRSAEKVIFKLSETLGRFEDLCDGINRCRIILNDQENFPPISVKEARADLAVLYEEAEKLGFDVVH